MAAIHPNHNRRSTLAKNMRPNQPVTSGSLNLDDEAGKGAAHACGTRIPDPPTGDANMVGDDQCPALGKTGHQHVLPYLNAQDEKADSFLLAISRELNNHHLNSSSFECGRDALVRGCSP
jgi:hypothetical protein